VHDHETHRRLLYGEKDRPLPALTNTTIGWRDRRRGRTSFCKSRKWLNKTIGHTPMNINLAGKMARTATYALLVQPTGGEFQKGAAIQRSRHEGRCREHRFRGHPRSPEIGVDDTVKMAVIAHFRSRARMST
jgi:hypothetical protein